MVELICLLMLTSCLEVAEAPKEQPKDAAGDASVAVELAPDDSVPEPVMGATAKLIRPERAPTPRPDTD